MDKRRSTGHYNSEGSSREHSRSSKKPPRRIANNEDFLDSSRDPRLNNVKYRAHMMSGGKSRVSPDTTMASKKAKTESKDSIDCQFCSQPVGSSKLNDHYFAKHRCICFACGLCPGQAAATFGSISNVRAHLAEEHSIENQELVDQLIKLPSSPSNLRSYKCVACPASASLIGTSEEELKEHFKAKHKIAVIKPFLIKKICRICEKSDFSTNDDLIKHIDSEHPRSLFWSDEEENEENNDKIIENENNMEDNEVEVKANEENDYFARDEEEELNYEPKSPTPTPPTRDPEASSVPEDGEISGDESKRRSRKRSRSDSTSSRSSRQSKVKVKPRQYRDSSSSSEDSRRRQKSKKLDNKRKVFLATGSNASTIGSHRGHNSGSGNRKDESFFGVTYIPPAGHCQECDQRYENGERAQEHFKSRRHFMNVKSKYRCYFCNIYVQDTKHHLETRHRDMTFQCLLRGCNRPRFTQADKVIDHVRCNHPNEFRSTRDDMDLFCKKMISMPKNIMSFTCRECRVVFHGDVKIAIVHLVLEHGENVPQRSHFVFSCRICGPKVRIDNEKELERHCQGHLDQVREALGRGGGENRQPLLGRGRSRSPRSQSSSQRSLTRSRSRSRSVSPHLKYGRNTLTCHFCPDQFRTLPVRKNHMLRDHGDLLFQCALCTFHNMYRRDLIWHLREHHRKDHGFSDEVLIRDFVHWPKDLRKVICRKCSESEAHDNAVWMAVDPNDITKELKAHAEFKHGLYGKEVDACYRLQCIGCDERFDLDKDIKEWDDHMERQPCRARNGRRRSPSRSRSRSPARPKRKSTPVEIDLEKHCLFCCKELDSKEDRDDHVRSRHLDSAFVCRLCDSDNPHYEADLPAIKKHLMDHHEKDDLDNEEVKDYTRYPKDLICIKCQLCGLLCHAQKEEDLELHFKIFHEESDFSSTHLDYLCRLCMETGQNDSIKEVRDHLYEQHPE